VFFVALVAASWSEAVDKGEQAFQENCSLCHPLDRPRAKHLTRDEWQQTIEKMIGFGCPIGNSKTAQAAVLDYLVRTQGPAATRPQASVSPPGAGGQ